MIKRSGTHARNRFGFIQLEQRDKASYYVNNSMQLILVTSMRRSILDDLSPTYLTMWWRVDGVKFKVVVVLPVIYLFARRTNNRGLYRNSAPALIEFKMHINHYC